MMKMIMIMIITTLGQQYVVKMTDNITKQVPSLWQWCFQEAVHTFCNRGWGAHTKRLQTQNVTQWWQRWLWQNSFIDIKINSFSGKKPREWITSRAQNCENVNKTEPSSPIIVVVHYHYLLQHHHPDLILVIFSPQRFSPHKFRTKTA